MYKRFLVFLVVAIAVASGMWLLMEMQIASIKKNNALVLKKTLQELQLDEKIVATDNQALDAISTCLVYDSVCSYKVLGQLVDDPLKQREQLMKEKYKNGNLQ